MEYYKNCKFFGFKAVQPPMNKISYCYLPHKDKLVGFGMVVNIIKENGGNFGLINY